MWPLLLIQRSPGENPERLPLKLLPSNVTGKIKLCCLVGRRPHAQLWRFLLGAPTGVVLFESQHLVKRNAVLPPGTFQIWFCREVVHVPETQVGYRDDVPWDVQHFFKRFVIENTQPSRHPPLPRELRAIGSAPHRLPNKVPFPALNGGQADVLV
jgi:hypothetical protein